jgi:phi13 family phage major tail protein
MATKRQIGLKDFHVCKIVSDTPGEGAVYESPVRVPGIISATMSTERTTENYYSDDIVEETFSSFNSISLEVEISNLSQDERALLLGQKVKAGVSAASADDVSSEVGIMFRSKRTDGRYRYVALTRGKLVEPSESFASESDSLSPQTLTLTFTGIPLQCNGIYKITADEGEEDIDPTYLRNFFQEMKWQLPVGTLSEE